MTTTLHEVRTMAFGFPDLASAGCTVPLSNGRWVPHSNLDHAASAPALATVADFTNELMAVVAGVKRGDGPNSLELTSAYAEARDVVRRYLGAPSDHAVLFTSNTTGAINTIANALRQKTITHHHRLLRVVGYGFEHNANILPWRLHTDLTTLPVPATHTDMLIALDTELARAPADLVAITGASNLTGEIPDLRAVAAIAHEHGALLLADFAQLAPHHPINMRSLGVDIGALSGHKLGAPAGVGALVCPRQLLEGTTPLLVGGGIVEAVYADGDADWYDNVETLHEPGSPNIIGALTLAVAMATLQRTGLDRIARAETMLLTLAHNILTGIDGVTVYHMWDWAHPKIGVITFNLTGFDWGLLCAVLSGEFGYATRGGCHCTHILVPHLLGINPDQAKLIGRQRRTEMKRLGTVRLSFGLDTTLQTLTDLDGILRYISRCGPGYWKTRYRECGDGHWEPIVDKRPQRLNFTGRTSW